MIISVKLQNGKKIVLHNGPLYFGILEAVHVLALLNEIRAIDVQITDRDTAEFQKAKKYSIGEDSNGEET